MEFIDLKSQYTHHKKSIDDHIFNVLNHGQYILGPEVERMEKSLAKYVGVNHCISVASGTEALLISLMALNIGPGDEVITTPFSFIATAEVIVLLGAKPVFVDVKFDTGIIDVKEIESKVTQYTKAIIPVSLYGQVPDIDQIIDIARKYPNISVIEDGAQSFGAIYKKSRSCGVGHIGCTSFFPSKPLGCYGDGGAIFTNNDEIASISRQIRVHGQKERYVHARIGVGGRMDTIQCAVILAKLNFFESEINLRRKIAHFYCGLLDQENIKYIAQDIQGESVYAQFTLIVENRDSVRDYLASRGIPTAVHYPIPINEQEPYRQFCCPDCTPIAHELAQKVLSLPMHPYLTDSEQVKVVNTLVEALNEA
jgi:UDP-2-acetamido-2-deoxy-ribo-hexuluronate aminotransferase